MHQYGKPSAPDLLDRDFVKFRSHMLDVAAFLDRLDRYEGSDLATHDYRYQALVEALEIISSGRQNRVREMLVLLSDPTLQPMEDQLAPAKAGGAWKDVSIDH